MACRCRPSPINLLEIGSRANKSSLLPLPARIEDASPPSPPRACNLIRRGRREIPGCISITLPLPVRPSKLDRTDPATLNFGLRTVGFAIKVTSNEGGWVSPSIDAMDREQRHTHTLTRGDWFGGGVLTLGLQFPEKDSAFDRPRRRMGNR